MLIDKANLSAHYRGFKTAFMNAFKRTESDWQKVAMLVPSTHKTEDYGWLGSFPKMREWLGARVVRNLKQFNHAITNKKYEVTVGVEREDFEDDNLGMYGNMMANMGEEAKKHPDDLVFPLLAAAFGNTLGLCYDGQFMCDTDHPMAGSTHSNDGAGSGNPWFLVDDRGSLMPIVYQERTKPEMQFLNSPGDERVIMNDQFLYGVRSRDAAGYGLWQLLYGSKDTLNASNFAAGKLAMRTVTDDSGNPLDIRPTLLVCGPANEAAAIALIEQEWLATGERNIYYKAVKLLVTPHLT